ncbi:hypothetical protein GCM10010336_50570 [Streptomyces goshikiensis]|nr:hypothetical protein GCM10010336_50570 [Streptomyces goshikiensis]
MHAVVPLTPGLGDELSEVREAMARVPGTSVQIAGPAASQADPLDDAFAGIDGLCWVWCWPQYW